MQVRILSYYITEKKEEVEERTKIGDVTIRLLLGHFSLNRSQYCKLS